VPKKFGQGSLWIRPRSIPLLQNFLRFFVRKDPINAPAKFEVRIALPVSELIGGSTNWAGPVYALIAYPPPKKNPIQSVYTHACTRPTVEVGLA